MQFKCLTRLFLLFAPLWFLSICHAQTEASHVAVPSDMWQQAVKISKGNQGWTPGKIITISEELDQDGNLVKSEEIWSRQYYDDSGDLHTEIVKDEVKGGNTGIQAEIKPGVSSKQDGEAGKKREMSLDKSLFDPEFQNQVSYHPSDQKKTINGRETMGYQFTVIQSGEEKSHGFAWIDIVTGAPLLAEFSPDPLPSEIREISKVVKYSFKNVDECYVTELLTEGKGEYLQMKSHFRIKILFQDYFKRK